MHLNSHKARGYRNAAIVLFLLAFGSCQQQTLEPTQSNDRLVRIETITPAGNPVKGVQVTISEDNTSGAHVDFQGPTGDGGAITARLAVPALGRLYQVDVQRSANGTLLYDRPIYPVKICPDTTIVIVVPEIDNTVPVDSVCSVNITRTLTFFACADSMQTQTYVLENDCPNAVTIDTASLNSNGISPFTFTSSTPFPIPVSPKPGSTTFTITYDARGQTAQTSKTIIVTSSGGGKLFLKLIGIPRTDCVAPPQPPIQCGIGTTTDSVNFGSVCLNKTSGPRCITFTNGNQPVTVTLLAAPAPFSYTVTPSASVPGSLSLPAGGTMTVCISIAPTTAGHPNSKLVFPMQCSGGAIFNYTVPLAANDTPCTNCSCSDFDEPLLTIGNNIPVGSDTTFTIEIFHNTLACPATIPAPPAGDGGPAWTINGFTMNGAQATFPLTVPVDARVSATIHFAPKQSGAPTDHIKYSINSPNSPPPCNGEADVRANGCDDACADTTMPGQWQSRFGKPDTLYLTQGGADTMFVSPALPASPTTSDPNICITIKMPDTACNKKAFQISGPTDRQHFSATLTPNPMTLSPGDSGTVCITFQVPTLLEVEQKYGGKANAEMKWTDAIQITDPGPGCGVKIIPIKALVDTVPPCDNFTLADYGVTGTDKTTYYQSWAFKTRIIAPNKTGDLYYSSGSLYSVDGQPRLLVWNEGPLANGLCTDKQQVLKDFNAFKPSLVGFSTSVSVSAGEIIIYAVPSGGYAVLQLGTPATSPQHGVDFLFSDYLYPMP